MGIFDKGTDGVGLTDVLTVLKNGVVAIGNLAQTIAKGNLNQVGTSTNAVAGTAGAPPAQVAGYVTTVVNGMTVKLPYYL